MRASAAEREEQRRFREWNAYANSLSLEHMHISHNRFDGSNYQYGGGSNISPQPYQYPSQTERPTPTQPDPGDPLNLFSDLPTSSQQQNSGYGSRRGYGYDPMSD